MEKVESKPASNEQMMGALAYLLGPVTGIILLITEKKNDFIRFHAMQSIIVFGGIILVHIVLAIIPVLGWMVLIVLAPILYIGGFILWVVLMWKAYNGERYKLPYAGDFAERQLKKL